jgi:hypothetical protein
VRSPRGTRQRYWRTRKRGGKKARKQESKKARKRTNR